jgi:hypothetical protein
VLDEDSSEQDEKFSEGSYCEEMYDAMNKFFC